MTGAERKAKQRARAKRLGLCLSCCAVKRRRGLTTCLPCGAAAQGRTKESRRRDTPGVYRIRHIESGDCYIGQSATPTGRWNSHRSLLRSRSHPSARFQAAWDLDGEEAFVFEMIEALDDRAERLAAEERHLRESLPAYNHKHVEPLSSNGDATRQRSLRGRRALAALCTRCPKRNQTPAAPGKSVCEACNEGAKARVAAGRAAKKAAK